MLLIRERCSSAVLLFLYFTAAVIFLGACPYRVDAIANPVTAKPDSITVQPTVLGKSPLIGVLEKDNAIASGSTISTKDSSVSVSVKMSSRHHRQRRAQITFLRGVSLTIFKLSSFRHFAFVSLFTKKYRKSYIKYNLFIINFL